MKVSLVSIYNLLVSHKGTITFCVTLSTALFTGLTVVYTRRLSYAADKGFKEGNEIRRQNLYSMLETMSIDLFKFAVEHPEVNTLYREELENPNLDFSKEESHTEIELNIFQYAASLLNLFEIHYNLRIKQQIDPNVFGSWVPWLREACYGAFFQRAWETNLYKHYTPKFRDFITLLINTVIKYPNDEEKFYSVVGEHLNCDIIKNWLPDRPMFKEYSSKKEDSQNLLN